LEFQWGNLNQSSSSKPTPQVGDIDRTSSWKDKIGPILQLAILLFFVICCLSQALSEDNSRRTTTIYVKTVDTQSPWEVKVNKCRRQMESGMRWKFTDCGDYDYSGTATAEYFDSLPTPSRIDETAAYQDYLHDLEQQTETVEKNQTNVSQECNQYSSGTVTCRIQKAHCLYKPEETGSPTFCGDAPYGYQSFTYVVWNQDVSYLEVHCIVVSRVIREYNGKLEVNTNYGAVFLGYCD